MELPVVAKGATESKGRNNLAAVKQYLQYGTFPKECNKVDKRAVRKRSKTFVFVDNQLYYTGGRPKRAGAEDGEDVAPKNPENDPDHTQVLRKCCTTEEEKQEAVMRCHIGDDGTHYGMDKTTERVSREFYWVGIINTVRKVLHSCDSCIARGLRCGANLNNLNLSNPLVTVSNQENGIKVEMEMGDEPDVFFVSQETCSYFWQKVELQVFGPYTAGRKSVYVAVALDCYSQFPEAMIIENISSAALTTFVLNLICRYGVMEKLCMLQNNSIKDIYMYINMQDLEIAGLTPNYLSLHANPADERWHRVSDHLERFVQSYPKTWDRCLEAFMVPLRISLPPRADYTPAYLTFNREPMLPEKLSHKKASDCSSEVRLSEDHEKETVDLLMTTYGRQSKTMAGQLSHTDFDLSMLPTVKLEALAPLSTTDVINLKDSAILPVHFEGEEQQEEGKKKRGRKRKEEALTKNSDDVYGGTTDDEGSDHLADFNDFHEDDSDETYQPASKAYDTTQKQSVMSTRSSSRKRIPTFKVKEESLAKKQKRTTSQTAAPPVEMTQPVKRKRGRPPKVRPESINAQQAGEAVTEASNSAAEKSKQPWGTALTSTGLMNSVELLDLDLYYLIIKSYKERNAYPPQVSVDFKRAVRRLAETVALKDGKLYGSAGKATGRLIIMKERERFCLLRKAHTRGEEHVGRVRALKTLLDMNVFWKGMSLDLDAFIHACPECVSSNPLRSKTVVRIPSLSKVVTEKDHDGDAHMSEDEEEGSSYEDLIQYLTDNTFPSTTTPHQESRIKQRAESFCIINGSLYYKSPARPDSQPRQVLFSEKTRQEAVKEAHIEDGNHLSQQDTQAKLRRQYFWSGMTYDIMIHIMACCMTEHLAATPIEHRSDVIQQRVSKFRKYYKEGIPDMVSDSQALGGIFAASTEQTPPDQATAGEAAEKDDGAENDATHKESSASVDANKESTPANAADPLRTKEDQIIWKAMEAAIVKMGGKMIESRRNPVKGRPIKGKSPSPKPQGPLTPNQLRVRKAKTKHKCDHCNRIIKGDVAFKVHLYKHTGIKPFSCNVCGKSFSNRKSQRIHMRKHTGIRPYLCNQCGRDFFRSASLRYHLKAHATGRGTPVQCDVCGRSFTTQHRMIRHKEFKHPAKAKVFMCNQCGKHFTAARSLKRHEQTHTGIRKYQCQYCTKAFFRKEYLNSHLTNHTEYDPEVERLKPRKKPAKKSSEPRKETVSVTAVVIPGPSGDTVPSNVIHWTESDQPVQQQAVTGLDSFQRQTVSLAPSHSASNVITSTSVSRLPPSSESSHTHTIHHTLRHPLAHAARLMNVAGPHGPVSVTVSTAGQPIEVLHTEHGQEIVLQHETVPVQYEVECLPGEAHLTEADLNAIHLLAQASMTGQNLHTM